MKRITNDVTFRRRAAAVLAAMAVAALTGCAKSPTLAEPVGETTVRSGRMSRKHREEPKDRAPAPNLELYLAQETELPCGMDRLPPVDFAAGSSELSPQQDAALTRLASCMRVAPHDTSRIVLVGRADPFGSKTYNLRLAYERAEQVRRRLLELGIAHPRILLTAAGESPLPRERWGEARRVDIVLTRPGESVPKP